MLPVAILAGGLANRLRPVTAEMPKSLIEIAGEPFLVHQLRLLRSQGIQSVVLCVGHLGEHIREFAGNGHAFGIDVAYSWDGAKLRGTAGALKNALPLLGREFFVMYGDSYLTCSFSRIEDAFFQASREGIMSVFRNDDRWDRSNVEFSHGEIRSYSKTNRTIGMQHIDYGLSVLRAEALSRIPDEQFCDLGDLYTSMLRDGQLAAIEVAERFYEIGSFGGIKDLCSLLRSHQDGKIAGTNEFHSAVPL